jgi:Ser/Thr protein kinase RdoA (MazF antagonist)
MNLMITPQPIVEAPSASLGRPLGVPAPDFSPDECLQIASGAFGIQAVAVLPFPFGAECDQLFRVTAAHGAEFTMRISNSAQDPEVLEFQNLAIEYAGARDPTLPIPRLVRSRDGQGVYFHKTAGQSYGIRILTYLPGRPILGFMTTAGLRKNIGMALARFDVAMRGFSHPKANPDMIWDIRNAGQVGKLDFDIADPRKRGVLDAAFARFERNAAPALAGLRTQVIHNDLNPKNVLIDECQTDRVTGIIDFGDMIDGPLVFDPAVAISKLILDLVDMQQLERTDAVAFSCDVLAGYCSVLPLQANEIAHLLDLIIVRLAMRVAIRGWRTKRNGERLDPAIVDSGAAALSYLLALPSEIVTAQFSKAAGR